jgi:hypothetical protein
MRTRPKAANDNVPNRPRTVQGMRRRQQTARRLAWLETCCSNDDAFKAIVRSGRYLKLCGALEMATDAHAAAAARA